MTYRKAYSDITVRGHIIFLKSPFGGSKSAKVIKNQLGGTEFELSESQINRIYQKAIDRGFTPNTPFFTINDEFVTNAPKTGRPQKQTEEIAELVFNKIKRDRFGREKTCSDIAIELALEGINIS